MTRPRAVLLPCATLLLALAAPAVLADESGVAYIDVTEANGAHVGDWPVTTGLFFEEGRLEAAALMEGRVRIVDASGAPVLAQFRVADRWGRYPYGPGPYVRWLEATFPATVAANSTSLYTLEWDAEPFPALTSDLSVEELAGVIAIRSGSGPASMMVVLNTTRFEALVESIIIDEKGDGFADDAPVITERRPGEAKLVYHRQGSLHTTRLGFEPLRVTVEEAGPYRTVLRAETTYDEAWTTMLRYTVYAGLPVLFVDETLIREGPGDARLDEHSLMLPLGMLETCDVTVGSGEMMPPDERKSEWTTTEPGNEVVLEQSVRRPPGRGPLGVGMDPDERFYVIRRGAGIETSGRDAPGWVKVRSGLRVAVAACAPFAEGWPKRMSVGGGDLRLELSASSADDPPVLGPGEAVRHRLMFHFPLGDAAPKPNDIALCFTAPPRVRGPQGDTGEDAPPAVDWATALPLDAPSLSAAAAQAFRTGDPWPRDLVDRSVAHYLTAPGAPTEALQLGYTWTWDPRFQWRLMAGAGGL